MPRNVAIAFLTKDRPELTEKTIRPLLKLPNVTVHWIDGSVTDEGRAMPGRIAMGQVPGQSRIIVHANIKGGPDAAVAYALTVMTRGHDYDYIGLCENDVLLPEDWYGPTMALFRRGHSDGLHVGAVSARAYEDRILFQRDGYAVMHNLGWGMQIMAKDAARLTLASMRTGVTSENRLIFGQRSGVDIGAWWAFRGVHSRICADWHNDAVLSAHGYASLALTPSPVEMIGQVPPLHQQGLKLVNEPFELRRDLEGFERFRFGPMVPLSRSLPESNGARAYFAHHMPAFHCYAERGNWALHFNQGFGPFVWEAATGDIPPTVSFLASGAIDLLVSGGASGGEVTARDSYTGYEVDKIQVSPEGPTGSVAAFNIPPAPVSREITLELSPGARFYGIRTDTEQVVNPTTSFNWHHLPKAG